jgi:hypothetical protein
MSKFGDPRGTYGPKIGSLMGIIGNATFCVEKRLMKKTRKRIEYTIFFAYYVALENNESKRMGRPESSCLKAEEYSLNKFQRMGRPEPSCLKAEEVLLWRTSRKIRGSHGTYEDLTEHARSTGIEPIYYILSGSEGINDKLA